MGTETERRDQALDLTKVVLGGLSDVAEACRRRIGLDADPDGNVAQDHLAFVQLAADCLVEMRDIIVGAGFIEAECQICLSAGRLMVSGVGSRECPKCEGRGWVRVVLFTEKKRPRATLPVNLYMELRAETMKIQRQSEREERRKSAATSATAGGADGIRRPSIGPSARLVGGGDGKEKGSGTAG